jgi:hypothetical protein
VEAFVNAIFDEAAMAELAALFGEEDLAAAGFRQHANKLCSHNNVHNCMNQVSGADSLCAICKAGNC